jgi:hypothetical protein
MTSAKRTKERYVMWVRRGSLAGIACLALVGFASQVASASPMFYTKAAIGEKGTTVTFTGTIGAALLEGAGSKEKMECESGSTSGDVVGPTETNSMFLELSGCALNGFLCASSESSGGNVLLNVLAGELGDVKAGTPGLRLFSQFGGRGAELVTVNCAGGAVGVKIKGSLIGALSGAAGTTVEEGKFASSNVLSYVQSAGVQKYSQFVGESGSEQLEWKLGEGAYEGVGFAGSLTLKAEGTDNMGFTK